MYDLIYDGTAWEVVQKRFPEAKIKDESDCIHEGRFGVELPDEMRDEYLRWVVLNGLGLVSLSIGLMLHASDGVGREKLKKWLDEAKTAKEEVKP